MNTLPIYLSVLFAVITLVTLWFVYRASSNSKTVLFVLSGWLILQGVIAYSDFYLQTKGMPPRFAIAILPPILSIVFLMATKKGKSLTDQLDIKHITYMNFIRVPVEFGLLLLFIHKQLPQIMTFEGRNFDIISGITAPIVAYLYFNKKIVGPKLMLAWNFICLGLVLNITTHGILSAPFDYQQFGFEQPNVGVLKFPFIWLPCFIVPVVIYSHLASIRQLIREMHAKKAMTGKTVTL